MFLSVTASVSSDGILSLIVLAASSDSKTTKLNPPPSPPPVQYPATNPCACDTPGTTCSRICLLAASGSLTVSVVTTACMGASFLPPGETIRLSTVLRHRPRSISPGTTAFHESSSLVRLLHLVQSATPRGRDPGNLRAGPDPVILLGE